jgi:hypothetical protein
MANTVIKLKKSATANEVPSDLEPGEIAINYADGKLFYKNTTNQIAEISGKASSPAFGIINVNNSLIVASVENTILTIKEGDNIVFTTDIINDAFTISANLSSVFSVANEAFNTANAALYISGFPIGDYAEGEPNLGTSESFDPFGVSLIIGFDCAATGSVKFTDLGPGL